MKHEFKSISKDAGDCDDAYCTGHRDYFLICSCGEELRAEGGNETRDIVKDLKTQLNHILEKEGMLGKLV